MEEKTTIEIPTQEEELVSKAYELFEEFNKAYESEWQRLDRNEKLYLGKHWEEMGSTDTDIQPMTPVVQSTAENLKADLMDNYPEAIIQPESPLDREIAEVVNALIKQNHDAMGYVKEFRNLTHDLVVGGYCVQESGYDPNANRGIGSAFIRYVNNHNILVDPQVTDIQDGRAVFKIAPRTINWLEQRYPDKQGKFQHDQYDLGTDAQLVYDKDKSVLQIEYWWREYSEEQGRWLVHMALLAGRQLLEDSRTEKPEGYFSVGEYPFVVTPLIRRKNSALGYGMPDSFGTMQMYADKLDQIALKNAAMASHNKLLLTEGSGFDADDLKDWDKEVHVGQSLGGITWFSTPPLPQYTVQAPAAMRQSIKEESGANDFSRGNTASGVTAASAIAALQEMSSKRSRMIAQQLHEAFKQAVRYEIEFEREFNVLPREVLLTVDGQQKTATFESAMMTRHTENGNNVPIEFFVSIKVQRENRWSVMAHNEVIMQMAQIGALTPQQTIELMIFEGKEELLNKSRQQQRMPSPEDIAMEEAAMEQTALDDAMAQLPQPEQMNNQIVAE